MGTACRAGRPWPSREGSALPARRRSPLGHARIAVGVDVGRAVGEGGDGAVSLEHQAAGVLHGKGARRPKAVARRQLAPSRTNSPSWGVSTVCSPRRLSKTSICPSSAFMPSASSTTGRWISPSRWRTTAATPFPRPRPGPIRQTPQPASRVIAASPPPGRAAPPCPQAGVGHGLIQLGRRDGPHRGRHSHRHQARAGAHRCLSREHRRAGIAHAAAQEIDLSKVPLWASRGRTGRRTSAPPPSVPDSPPRPPSPGVCRCPPRSARRCTGRLCPHNAPPWEA